MQAGTNGMFFLSKREKPSLIKETAMSKKSKAWLFQKNEQSHFDGEEGTKSWN